MLEDAAILPSHSRRPLGSAAILDSSCPGMYSLQSLEGQVLNTLPEIPSALRWMEAAKIASPRPRTEEETKNEFYRIKTRYRLSGRERAASERDRALAYPSTKRCGNERSRYLQYLKSVFGGEYKGDMTNVFIYLETGQLLPIRPSTA